MKKLTILLSLLLFCGLTAFAAEANHDVEIKNFGEIYDFYGYTGVIIKLKIGDVEKWVVIHEGLNQNRILSIAMWAKTNGSKVTVIVDDFSKGAPVLQYLKLNQPDFEY